MEEGNNKRQTSASVVAWLAEVCLDGLHCPMATASGDAVYFLGLLWRMRAVLFSCLEMIEQILLQIFQNVHFIDNPGKSLSE